MGRVSMHWLVPPSFLHATSITPRGYCEGLMRQCSHQWDCH